MMTQYKQEEHYITEVVEMKIRTTSTCYQYADIYDYFTVDADDGVIRTPLGRLMAKMLKKPRCMPRLSHTYV